MIYSLDLFSGAGGFTLGLKEAGISCTGALEIDRFACETFRNNFPTSKLFQCDIREFSDNKIRQSFNGVDLIIAGPPCQGFSVAGPSQYGIIDPRNHLIFEVFRFVKILKPVVCVLENVKGILSGKLTNEKRALKEYVSKMEAVGYQHEIFVLQTADFGVPQWRERVFIIAARKRSYIPIAIKGSFGTPKRPWRTVEEAINDLLLIDSGEGINELVPYPVKAKNSYQKWLRKGSKGITNHVAMKHTQRLIDRFKHIPIGGSLLDAPKEFGQRVRNGVELDVRPRFKMNNQRLSPHEVSKAITASFQSNFVHPTLNRNLTAREGARLQSFPDRFTFHGPRTLMSKKLLIRESRFDEIGVSQYNQIGNSVPPLVGKAIGKAILRTLRI